MADAPLILGVSGLRGIVGESLTPEVAVRYAGAFADWLRDHRDVETIYVGKDGREGGDAIYHAVIAGLASAGFDVVAGGVLTTPTVGVVAHYAAAGVVITASHNPSKWNGVKCLIPDDCTWSSCHAPSKVQADHIVASFRDGSVDAISPHGRSGDVRNVAADELVDTHVKKVFSGWFAQTKGMRESTQRIRAVADSVNASGAVATEALLRKLKVHLIQLHGDGSGIFPHTPEPTAENLSGEGGLCDAVPGLKADVGFAQDPDADRLAIVDERGRYIGEEYTLVLCAQALLRDRGADEPTAHLVANLSTSRMIDDVAAKHGAVVHRTAVGEANVVERMKSLKAEGHEVVLGGEGNGGVIWPEVVYVRDSLGSMALVLSLMARTGKTVSELVAEIDALAAGGAGYAIVKRKVEIASKADAEPAVQAVARAYASERVDRQDGVRVDFDSGAKAGKWAGSWVHVRASNTEPIMRVIAEAPTAEAAGALADEVGG
ncbi:MAG: hypothetical protein AAFP26_12785, partial [Planctomycetota bacterium]